MWNCDTNIKNVLASLAHIFLRWNSLQNSFEACFNFNLITVYTSCGKKKENHGVLKGLIITHHHRPTWIVGVQLFTHLQLLNFVTRHAIVACSCFSYVKAWGICFCFLLSIAFLSAFNPALCGILGVKTHYVSSH